MIPRLCSITLLDELYHSIHHDSKFNIRETNLELLDMGIHNFQNMHPKARIFQWTSVNLAALYDIP